MQRLKQSRTTQLELSSSSTAYSLDVPAAEAASTVAAAAAAGKMLVSMCGISVAGPVEDAAMLLYYSLCRDEI